MSSSAQRLLRGGPPDAWLAASTSAMPSSSSRLDGLNALDAFLAPPMTADSGSSLDLWLGTTFGARDYDVDVGGLDLPPLAPTRPGFVDPFDLGTTPEAFLALPRLPATIAAPPPASTELPKTVNDQPIPVVTSTSGRPVRRTATTAAAKRRRLSLLADAGDAGAGEDDGDDDYAAPPEEMGPVAVSGGSGAVAVGAASESAGASAVVKENTRRARNTEASGPSDSCTTERH